MPLNSARNLIFYLFLLLSCGGGTWFALKAGGSLEKGAQESEAKLVAISHAPQMEKGPATSGNFLVEKVRAKMKRSLSLLLVQIILIVVLAHLFGLLFERLGLPAVVGEMLAGILLGPSLIGNLFPEVFAALFPEASLGRLKMLSHVGILLFMFVIGLELDVKSLRKKAHVAVLVSHSGIFFPFFLGVSLSLYLFTRYAPPQVDFLPFALFVGIALSITAFPVLARIIEDRKMTGTFLGTTAITCAAVDDVTAWSLLAIVVAFAGSQGIAASFSVILMAGVFALVMLFLARPLLRRLVKAAHGSHPPGKGLVAFILLFLFFSALVTELIGVHALFGAFMAGLVLPQDPRFKAFLRTRLEYFSSIFLLPIFFAFTGLRTQVGLLENASDWVICALIILVAVLGKFGGSLVAARFTGVSWKESAALGILMNTRGLMELIVLNIGYDMGILSPKLFTMLVIMALATTFMTGPLLTALRLPKAKPDPDGTERELAVAGY